MRVINQAHRSAGDTHTVEARTGDIATQTAHPLSCARLVTLFTTR